jgi:erythronate-4-phosphate dehydrogenase
VKDADALIVRTRTKCNRALLEGSSVKFIATATIGYDHIDTAWCEAAGIRWINAPGCNSGSVEQYIVSVLLNLPELRGTDPAGKTLGIIGVGNVGSKVARAAAALGYHVLLNDPPRAEEEGETAFTDLDALLGKSDIVTVHVPLANHGKYPTRHLADDNLFSAMKQGAVFINTSRGEVVDETALKGALRSGKLSAAVLDVYENEPAVDRELLSLLAIATPHIAGYSTDGKANGTTMSVRAVSEFFGLGMDQWAPADVPPPEEPDLFVDGAEANTMEIIREAYGMTYDVLVDRENFMAHMDQFEKLRGEYRVRREPSAYNVHVYNDDGNYRKILEGLGFGVIGDSCF